MQLGRYQVSTLRPPPILSISFSQDGRYIAIATETGYEIWRSYPLGLVRRRVLAGTLALALPLPSSPLLVLQGGGSTPLYPPNKVVIFHDALGVAIAELEFGERIRGVAVRHSTIMIALRHRVTAYEYGIGSGVTEDGRAKGKGKGVSGAGAGDGHGFWLRKLGQWETSQNDLGLLAVATAPGSTMLALPGRQAGHVQLLHLPPCPSSANRPTSPQSHSSTTFRSPIILAHTHPLSTLSCTASGSHLLTTSERGTLLRVWDTARGRLERELRRGVDRAEMWGVTFEDLTFPLRSQGLDNSDIASDAEIRRREEAKRKGGRVVGWSDKGTIHVWESEAAGEGSKSSSNPPTLTHLLSRNLPLPKYFSSPPSFAQYHLPRKNPHAFQSVVGAAAGKAGVTSLRNPPTSSGADEELSERFVVGWIEVDVPSGESVEDDQSAGAGGKRSSFPVGPLGGGGIGIGMGTREERRSFGSDATSTRTATPTPATATATATGRDTPRISKPKHVRASSNSSTATTRKGGTSKTVIGSSAKEKQMRTQKERQLIAVTYSGDWYRLKIPLSNSTPGPGPGQAGSEDEGKKGKCELVEYRRLGVGGGGW